MAKVITLKSFTDEIANGNPFDITFVKADKDRNLGGQIVNLKEVKLSTKSSKMALLNLILKNGSMRRCHIRLVIEYNGQKIVY